MKSKDITGCHSSLVFSTRAFELVQSLRKFDLIQHLSSPLGHLSHLYGNSFPVFVVFLQHTLGTWQASLLLCTPMASCPNFLAPNSSQMGPGQFQIYSTSSAQKILPTERLWDVSLRPSSPGGSQFWSSLRNIKDVTS